MAFENISPGQGEVYGPVIVDFKEAIQTNPAMAMTLGFDGATKMWDDELNSIEAYPMYVWRNRKDRQFGEHHEEIFKDGHLDEHLMHRYIASDRFLSAWDNLVQGDFMDGSEFADIDFVLLPSRVCAFLLQRRRFAFIAGEGLSPLQPDSKNWDNLFLSMDNKETVKAQTMGHFRNKKMRNELGSNNHSDLNREKGMGLIILLHGVPGVGKY
jgi:hypothetical protein